MTCSSLPRVAPAVLAGLLLAAAPAAAARIKFATLAPEGTAAMKAMEELAAEVEKKTGGGVKFKFYAGGRQGDEKDMVRKIRVGQLHAGGFTGVGIGEIAPELRILDAPWLFRTHDEIDHVYKTFSGELEKILDKNGYTLLGWTEVGFVHVFSNTPVRKPADMKKLKIWVWEGDPIAEAAFEVLGVHPIPLSITDVNTSLQTGLIDSVYSSPSYAIALQWHEKTKYVYAVPMANASGAVLVSNRAMKRLKPEEREALLETARVRLARLNEDIRRENAEALKTLKKQGLEVTETLSKAEWAKYEELGRKARRSLAGRLYSKDLLERVESELESFRRNKATKKP